MGYFPSMKFASGFEILEYCQSMATKFGFYDHCLFHTTVERTEWDEAAGRWTVYTDRGDTMRARYVILANGILTSPKLARIDGMETFEGVAFHTSRWDYNVDLEGKTIGIIGTGATAVQAVPELAKVAGHLYVFQRTPSTIDVRDQRATTPEEIETWSKEPGWARARRARFAKIAQGRTAIKANDDYLAGKVDDYRERKEHATRLSPEELMSKQLDTNFRIMEQIRARVDAIVEDPKTAEALKPYYPYGCKRPTFHDEYLPTFNRPNVTLVDTAPDRCHRDQRPRRGPRRRRVPARRADLRHRLPVDGHVDVQHDRRPRRPLAQREVADRGHQDLPRPALQRLPQPVHRHRPAGRRRQLQLHRRHRHPRRLRGVDALRAARPRRADRRRHRSSPRTAYAEHCRTSDIATAPLRDCLSYYNGHGNAAPGSLAYYGGGQWHKWRAARRRRRWSRTCSAASTSRPTPSARAARSAGPRPGGPVARARPGRRRRAA